MERGDEALTMSLLQVVIARLDRAIQYSRDSRGRSRSRGVLDHPLEAGDDDGGGGMTALHVGVR
jgi:hypothetical protein